MPLLDGKRKLPSSRSSRDVKGGIVTIKKKKALHKKANHEKERKANAALLQVINIDEEFKLGTCKNYVRYNDRILQGGEWKKGNDMEMV